MKVDNMALTLFQKCPALYFLRIRQGYTLRKPTAAKAFGLAFHAGLAMWYRTGNELNAKLAVSESYPEGLPPDDFRTKQKCIDTLMAYIREYPEETFKAIVAPSGPLLEVHYTLPTGLYLSCLNCGEVPVDDSGNCLICGEPREAIEYGGIFDGLVEFSGAVFVLEHKTTTQLGPYYFNQFRPNNQVTGYVWGGGLLSGQRVGGAIINAIGIYKSSAPRFKREVTMRSQEEIAEWLVAIKYTCEQIRAAEMNNNWPLWTNNCTMYGRCEFHPVHELPHEKQRLALLEQDYVISPWEYEHRDESSE